MNTASALAEVEALRFMLNEACDALLGKIEIGLSLAADPSADIHTASDVFSDMLSLCSFQDLAGQRLTRLAALISDAPADTRPDAHLLNGPSDIAGLSQGAADALFDAR